jgi:hypothetical protein
MKDFRLATLSVNVIVQFFKCEILMLSTFFFLIANCTLCITEVESVEAEGVIRLTGGRQPGNILTKLLYFATNKLSAEKCCVLHG